MAETLNEFDEEQMTRLLDEGCLLLVPYGLFEFELMSHALGTMLPQTTNRCVRKGKKRTGGFSRVIF